MQTWFLFLPWDPINSLKASNFRNLMDMARLDWKLTKIWRFDFVQKSNLIGIDHWLNLSQNNSESFYYIYMMHTTRIRVENLTQEPYSKLKKTVANKQSAILFPAVFNRFWGVQHIPWYLLSRSRPLLWSKPSRIVKSEIGLFLKISKSYSVIHALLTCFVFVFVISDVFASFLGTLIEFPWPESWYTIARVSELDLGLCLNGKIGP